MPPGTGALFPPAHPWNGQRGHGLSYKMRPALYCAAMSAQIDLEVLRRSFLLHNLPQQELEQVAAVMRPRHYRRDAPVFYQEDPGAELHVVVQGYLKVVVPTEAGEEAVLTVLGPGDLFG